MLLVAVGERCFAQVATAKRHAAAVGQQRREFCAVRRRRRTRSSLRADLHSRAGSNGCAQNEQETAPLAIASARREVSSRSRATLRLTGGLAACMLAFPAYFVGGGRGPPLMMMFVGRLDVVSRRR